MNNTTLIGLAAMLALVLLARRQQRYVPPLSEGSTSVRLIY